MNKKRRTFKPIESLLTLGNKQYFSYTARIIVTIIIFLLVSISVGLISSKVFKLGNNDTISYEETGTTDYKVYLKSNTFYEKEYLEKGMMYVASLIKNINLDFNYKFESSEELDYVLTYDVMAKINITNAAGTSVILEKEYALKENQRVEVIDSKVAEIKENVIIDYDYYNKLANSFKTTYDIEPASNLIIYLVINKQVSQDDEILNVNKEEQMDIVIPLTEKTVDVSIDESKIENSGTATKTIRFSLKNIVLIVIDTILFIICILILAEFIELLSFLRPNLSKYDKTVKRLLKSNEGFVVTSKTSIDFSNKTIVKINTFDELLDVRDSIKLPIVYHSLIDHHECEFYIQHNEVVYLYNLKSIDLEKKDNINQKEPIFNKIYRGEFNDIQSTTDVVEEPKEIKQEEVIEEKVEEQESSFIFEPPIEEKQSIETPVIEEPINKSVENIISKLDAVEFGTNNIQSLDELKKELDNSNKEESNTFDSNVFDQNIVLPSFEETIKPIPVVEPTTPVVEESTFIFEPPIEEIKEEKQFNINDVIPQQKLEEVVHTKKVEIPDIELNVENFKFEEENEEVKPVFSFSSILPRFKDTVDKVITKQQEEIYEDPFYIEQPEFNPEYVEPTFERIELSEETKVKPKKEPELVIEDLLKVPEYVQPTLELINDEPIKEIVEEPKEEVLEVKSTKKMEFDDDINKIIEERVEKLVQKKLDSILKEKEKVKEEKPKKEVKEKVVKEPKKETKTTKKEPKKVEVKKEKVVKEEPKVEAKEDPKKVEKKEEVKPEVKEEVKKEVKATKKQKTIVDYEKELEAILTRNFNKDE